MPSASASCLRRDIGVSAVICSPTASESVSYIEMRAHSPPRSNSVPSAQVTTCEPLVAIAASWISRWVRSAIVV